MFSGPPINAPPRNMKMLRAFRALRILRLLRLLKLQRLVNIAYDFISSISVRRWMMVDAGWWWHRTSPPWFLRKNIWSHCFPIGSMYGIYANIWGILMVNVTIYSIHGSYGFMCKIIRYRWNLLIILDVIANKQTCLCVYMWVLFELPGRQDKSQNTRWFCFCQENVSTNTCCHAGVNQVCTDSESCICQAVKYN